jgi:hypothetical protein
MTEPSRLRFVNCLILAYFVENWNFGRPAVRGTPPQKPLIGVEGGPCLIAGVRDGSTEISTEHIEGLAKVVVQHE